jgi:predicted KAP-like P-loop ATPase
MEHEPIPDAGHGTPASAGAPTFYSDQPIADVAHDRLGRGQLARAIADQLATAPADAGFVVGLFGPWGSGKTSLLNMIRKDLEARERIVPIWFNPWLFAGAEQLVFRFFQQIAAELRLRPERSVRDVAEKVAGFGQTLGTLSFLPGAGTILAAAGGLSGGVRRFLKKGPPSAIEQRDRLTIQLAKLDRRVVVMIDDIDRLPCEEVRDVMRLVRLTADFPNMVLLVAFARDRVEAALSDSSEAGLAYLAKIIQVSYDVPAIRRSDLTSFLLERLNVLLANHDTGPFDEKQWQNLFLQGIRPLFSSLRDIKRYLNVLPVTLDTIGDEIALADILALEALRVQVPDVHQRLPESIELLTSTTEHGLKHEERTAGLEEVLKLAGPHREAVAEMVKHLFPASTGTYGAQWEDTWAQERRVALERVLSFYLERSLPAGILPARGVQEIFELLGDPDRLQARLAALSAVELEHTLSRLEDFEDKFPPDVAEAALPVLMNQQHRLREGRGQGFLDFGADLALSRVALRLLKRVPEESERDRIVQAVLPRIHQLSARLDLLDTVGHQENAGSELISKEVWEQQLRELCQTTVTADPEQLAGERDLAALMWRVEQHVDGPRRESLQRLLRSSQFVLALLRSGLTEGFSQTMGEAAQTKHWRLPWEGFEKVFGEDEWTKAVSDALSKPNLLGGRDRERIAIETAKRYLSGWRPNGYPVNDS